MHIGGSRSWTALVAALALAGSLLVGCGAAGGGAAGGGKAAGGGGSCATGAAGSASNITVPQEPDSGVSKITGKCWAKIAPTVVGSTLPGVGTGQIPGGKSPTVQLAWSPTDLYVKCNVYIWPIPSPASTTNLWQDDACEFMLSGDDSHDSSYSGPALQVVALYSGGTPALGTQGSAQNGTAKASDFPVQAVTNTGKGYTVELTAPWSALFVTKPAKAQQYAFDLGVDFNNAGGSYIAYADIGGTASAHPCCNMTAWSQITLG